jgi:hypothetical protein
VEISRVMFLKEVQQFQAMILDTGCPKSLVGYEWLEIFEEIKSSKERSEIKGMFPKISFWTQ